MTFPLKTHCRCLIFILLPSFSIISAGLAGSQDVPLSYELDASSSIEPSVTPSPFVLTPPLTGDPSQATVAVTELPNPIFTTSDACVTCQKKYITIKNCSTLLPPPRVNLTTMVQFLPCICQNNDTEIEALQQCSICFRSTGQFAYLPLQLYNVSNQEVKALKKVCHETANGGKVPSSLGTGKWDAWILSARWMIVSTLFALALPLVHQS
ncbi:MAG: hypothetical protein J3Q66DRAFT_368717 [Benniella sp.]|nr:MAG: hypothetical protein J3Q66DRAFT_368717 [Benniella sp.]